MKIIKKKFDISCCKSYLTPRGRCYSCPEQDINHDPDEEEWQLN